MEINNRIGPKVKQVPMECCHASTEFFFWGGCINYNSLPLGPIQSSSHSTKELHGTSYQQQQSILGYQPVQGEKDISERDLHWEQTTGKWRLEDLGKGYSRHCRSNYLHSARCK